MAESASESRAFRHRLNRIYGRYTLGFIAFIAVIAGFEQMGMARRWIGVIFLLATVALYAVIGIISRTTDPVEY